MSTNFFVKHVVAIKETSPWFTLGSVVPLQLARSGTEVIVRRYYLNELQLPVVPHAVKLLLLNLGYVGILSQQRLTPHHAFYSWLL